MKNTISLVSVIIPVYKVEEYLKRCVDSVIAQTYKNMEIILVDDGSPDGCGAICDEYAKADSRVVVIHKENGGVSSARNAGIDAASGEYICFVDSDDTVDEDYILLLLESLMESNADMSVCGRLNIDVDDTVRNIHSPDKKHFVKGKIGENDIDYICDKSYMWVTGAKLFKRELIDKLRYNTSLSFAEDTVFNFEYLSKCNAVAYISNTLYYYHVGNSELAIKYHENMLEAGICRFEAINNGIAAFALGNANINDYLAKKKRIYAITAFYNITDHYYNHLYSKSCELDDFGRKKYNKAFEYLSRYFLPTSQLGNADTVLTEKNQYYIGVLNNWNCDEYFRLQKKYRKKEINRRRMIKLKKRINRMFKKR